jgi:hypothetical protein
MIDHAPRIRAKQKRTLARLLLAFILLVFVLSGWFFIQTLLDVWGRLKADEHQSRVLAECLNGRPVALGNSILRCNIEHYNLVSLDGGSHDGAD